MNRFFLFIKESHFQIDERRRRVIFRLKSLTPDMERIHISTIYHFLKGKCPKMVTSLVLENQIRIHILLGH
jgi:hypothetical protein